jgi:hypothetical protein
MLLGAGQGRSRLSFDDGGHDLDVLALAPGCRSRQLPGLRSHRARFGGFHVELMDPRSCYVGEREGRIFNDCPVEGITRPVPRRENTVDAVAVKRRGTVRYGCKRKIVPISVHLPLLPDKGRIALQHETN